MAITSISSTSYQRLCTASRSCIECRNKSMPMQQHEQEAAEGYIANEDESIANYMPREDNDMPQPEHVILVSDNEFTEEEDPSEVEMFEDDEFLDA
ncbi:hypothetical protein L484_024509 [Morus notabilis]|uniref:Uncharacterized protein n=1 Tax=Morus notabilis TaxID=981085 RepID=W9RHK5_9ROSA|nr:hypothetical protein L484_024509 [Morus notabilis]